jgi:hypothetical protein
METDRMNILKRLEAGQIGVEEAATLLAALERVEAAAQPEALPEMVQADALDIEVPAARLSEPPENPWARFWIYPMMAGGGILILGALVMALVYATGAARGWLVCGWLPMLLGLGIMLLVLWSRRAPWLHVRISEEGKRKMTLSFPVPLSLAAWVVRIIKPFVPQLRETGVDELILALRDSRVRGEPLYIDVQDDEEGERVEVYFG